MKQHEIKETVRESYSKIAKSEDSCCAPCSTSCGSAELIPDLSKSIGYSSDELKSVPQGANLGLGCGNPTAISSLREGEIVLDLGSGAGFDCFLAANMVGESGQVIGVDMTPEMINKAQTKAEKGNYNNVEFRLGEIENLPVADNVIDVVISNCVINLSPDKRKVYQETYRVLKPGGRFIISDIVVSKELPSFIKDSIESYIGCVSGALLKNDYLNIINDSGFGKVNVVKETPFSFDLLRNDPNIKTIIQDTRLTESDAEELAITILSITVQGYKPE